MNTRKLGNTYESQACKFLIDEGYEILDRNYQKRDGEIDIIVIKNEIISFVEVKYRKSDIFYTPSEAVTISKQKKIIKTAQYYIYEKNFNCNYNYTFDIIEIVGDTNRITHITNAFI